MTSPGYVAPRTSSPPSGVRPVVAPPPGSDPIFARVAEILLAGYAVEKTAKLIAAVLGYRVKLAVLRTALGLASHAHAARPKLKAYGIERRSAAADIARATAADDVHYRAAFIVNSATRMQQKVDEGASLKEALGSEAANYEAHRRARDKRLDAAARVANNASMFGPLLGWYRNHALDSDADCIAADGANFIAVIPPIIGYPGSVHPNCGCSSGPPHDTERTVDEAVAFLVRRGRSVASRKGKKAARRAS